MKTKSLIEQKKTKLIPFTKSDTGRSSSELDRNSEIALSAFYKSEARGYEPGHELQDWLDAEAEVENLIKNYN